MVSSKYISNVLKPMADGIGYFSASGITEKNAQAEVNAEVRNKFPYPPRDCDHALTIIDNLNNEIKITNEKIASGVTNRVGKRYLTAYQEVIAEFQTWTNASQCIKQALKQDDAAFAAQLEQALNKETQQTGNKKIMDNAVIYGSLGILVIGALFLIFK